MERPVSLRREWPEHPTWEFAVCAALIAIGLFSSVLGLFGVFSPGGWLEGATQARIPELAADLEGYTAIEARSLLGDPSFVRHEPPAEIWQYRAGDCVLDVYVYSANRSEAVQHAEVRPHDRTRKNTPEFDRSCLRSLRLASTN